MKKLLLVLFTFLLIVPMAEATHLAGGTIEVVCIGGNQFRIRLVKYRDPGGVPLPNNANVIVDPIGAGASQTYLLTQLSVTPSLPIPSTNPCLVPPPGSSLEEKVYQSGIITLQNGTGYYLYHMDNARNTLNNLQNIGGPGSPMTLYAEFPDPGTYGCNNSPIFNNNPPMAVCLNQPLNYDGSAVDPDGDVLQYRLCNALTYTATNNTPPFPVAPYIGGWGGNNPVSANPQLTVNTTTGLITGTPNLIGGSGGRWVFNYCVDEYRGGIKIGQYNREVQMTVTNCNQAITAGIGTQYTSINLGVSVISSGNDSTVTFTNTSNVPNGIWSWDFGVPGITTDTSSAFSPTYTYPDTGTYTVTLILNAGFPCADTVYSTVLVYPTVTANFNNSSPACVGTPITFTDLSTTTYGTVNYWNWQFGNGGSSVGQNPAINQNPTYTYNTQGNYNVRLIIETSKGVRDTFSVIVQVGTTPVVSAGPQRTTCSGVPTTLQGSATPGATYSWAPSTGLSCTNCAQPSVTRSSPGVYIYTLTVTGPTGCTNQATVNLVVTSAPTVSAGSDKYLCGVGSTQINGSVTGASSQWTFTWSPTTALSPTNSLTPAASPANTTSYTLTVTTSNGCIVRDTVTVFVNSISADAGANRTICPGASSQLNGSSTVGGVSYSWSPAASLSNGSIANPVATPSSTTTYTLTVTDPVSGCSGTDTVRITVNNLPPVNAGADTTICVNTSASLQATGATAYVWVADPSLSCTNCSSPTASPGTNTMYYVTGSDAIGCRNRDSVLVTVAPLPTASIAQAPSVLICPQSSVQLNASGGSTYSWNPSNSLNCSNCSNPQASPNNNTVYTVTVTDANNCSNTASVQVNIATPPVVNTSPNTSVCAGDTTQLSAGGGVSYSWAPAAGLDNPNISNPKAFPASTTTYTVTVTDGNGCTNTGTVTVTVNQLAAGAFISDTSICVGGSVQLYANGFSQYTWSPGGSLSCTNCASPTATPSSTTTYTVDVSDVNGCTDQGTVQVTVNPLPTVTTSPSAGICFGDSITLSATGGVSYSWAPGGSLDDPSIRTPKAKPLSTTTYTVTVTDANGCVNTATTTITVRALPTVVTSADPTICEGDTAQLSASGGTSYAWTPGGSLSCINCPDPLANPALTTTYSVEVTDQFGCKNTGDVTVTVNVLQPGNFIPDTSICIGDNIQLFANGFSQYTWSPGGSLSCTNCPSPIANPQTTTTYNVAVEDPNGCQDTGQVTVTVNPLPVANIQAADDSICLGSTTTMTASGGISYAWTPSTGLSCSSCPQPTVASQTTRTYNVEVTDANGCINTTSQTIEVLPLPTISKSSDTYVCKYDSTQLSVSGGVSYQWSPNYRMTCNGCPDPIVFPLVTTNYTVDVTDQYGCVNKDSIEIAVNAASSNITPDTNLCIGNSIGLQISGGVSYTWAPSTGLSCTNCPTPTANPSATTTYSVVVVDVNGCRDTGTVEVVVNNLPNVSAGNDVTICAGQSSNLNASGAFTYSWSPGTGLSNTAIANPTASPANTITYTVTGTDANGCTDSDDVMVEVNPLPQTNAGQDVSICLGEDTQLQASGANTYQWSPGTGLSCTNCPDPIADPTTTTTYTVTGMLPTGCTQTDEITVTVNALPTVAVSPTSQGICIGDNVTLTASGGTSYQWSPAAGLSCTNCSNPIATPAVTTTYTVTGFGAGGCSAEATATINVASPATVDITPDTAICPGESITLSATGGVTYAWTPVNQNTASITVSPGQSTTYTVDIVDANGCDIQGTVQVVVNTPADPLAGADATICFGDTALLSASNGATYSWAPTSGVFNPSAGNTGVSPSSTNTYTVTIVDNNGCTNTDEVQITVIQPPNVDAGPDLSIYEGDRAVLQATGAVSYLWSPTTWIDNPTSDRSIIYPEDTITYFVVGTDAFGCTGTDSVSVFVLPKPTYYVPTGFSPNNDGKNDKFGIFYPTNFNLVSMRIYDRWGTLIFETDDIARGWEGFGPGGEPMPMGTYVFVIEAVDDIGFPITRTGNITLIR